MAAVCNRLLSQTCLPPACLNESMCRLYVQVLQYHPIQEAEKTYCHQAQANPLETQWRCTRCFRKVFKHFPQCLSKTVTSHRPAVGTGRNGTWGHTIHCQYNQYTARPFTRTGAMENLAPVGSLKPLGWHPSTARRGPAYRRNPRDSTGKWIEEPSNSTLNGRKHVI